MANYDRNLKDTVVEQQKIINYLQQRYREDTGSTLPLPQSWSTFLGVSDKDTPNQNFEETKKGEIDPTQQELGAPATFIRSSTHEETGQSKEQGRPQKTIMQAFFDMKLPTKLPEQGNRRPGGSTAAARTSEASRVAKQASSSVNNTRRKQITTTFDEKNPAHMIQKIELSNIAHFTRTAFRDLLDRVVDMRCLNTVILSRNGFDDTFVDELEAIFMNKRIVNIDLSENNIGRSTITQLTKLMKDGAIDHIEWLEYSSFRLMTFLVFQSSLSRNNFSHDIKTMENFMVSLRKQKNLFHLAIDGKHDIKTEDIVEYTKCFKDLEKSCSAQHITSLLIVKPFRFPQFSFLVWATSGPQKSQVSSFN